MDENCLAYGIEISDSDWEKTPASVKQLVEKMEQYIKESDKRFADLEAKYQELLEKINRTSKNSSSPPSSDPLNTEKQKQKNKSDKKRGYQFTQWLDYYGKIWDKAVVAVSPNYTSQDCSHCGHRVKKSLSTRTHSCSSCGVEICRDTNAAINILQKGMKILGFEWQSNSTFGQKGSASQEGKHGEKIVNTIDRKLDIASGFL
jgi:predicted RNA-binding Zn-ribbon protein involved in translation (DUF1610 family)